jgi:hypothetical protein
MRLQIYIDLDQIPIVLIYRLVIANRTTERNFVAGEILRETNIKFLIIQNYISLRFKQ